jgi:thiol-disulfide isomerase/thioredoxin
LCLCVCYVRDRVSVCACVSGLVMGFVWNSWRKIKHDLKSELTEASATGAILSIVAGIFMLYLVFSQISEYRTLKSETQVMLDHYSHMNGGGMDDEDTLQINFNFSFPHLSCEYASVDATNFMGTHDAGIAARVSKIHLDKIGRQLGPHKDRKQQNHATDETAHEGEIKSVSLTLDNFEMERKKHDIIIVNFFTPWCHWCQKLEPVWEKAAAKMFETHPGDERLILAKVDCTSDKSEALCTTHKIDAFPTIMVFRRDDMSDSQRERYHGERTVDAITGWANELMKQIKSEVPKSRVVDADKDGEKDSHNGVGCMVSLSLPLPSFSLPLPPCPLAPVPTRPVIHTFLPYIIPLSTCILLSANSPLVGLSSTLASPAVVNRPIPMAH